MSLLLVVEEMMMTVANRKGIWPQKLCTNYSLWIVECTLPSHTTSSITTVPSPVWEGHGGMALNRMYGWSGRNQLTQIHLEGRPQ